MSEKKINVLVVALHYYDEQEKMMLKICKNGVSAAHHTLLNNLINGLSECSNVTVLSSLPVGSFPKMSKKIIVRSNRRTNGVEIGFVNLPIIKDCIRKNAVKRQIIKWYRELDNDNDCFIVVYDAIYYFLEAAIEAKRCIKKIKNILMVPDLPGKYSIENKTYNKYIEHRLNVKAQKFYNIVKEFDAFIPLSKHMMSAMKLEDKPYLVVECIVNGSATVFSSPKWTRPIKIMYAGELSPKVNIDTLVEAVKLIDGCELIICGRGSMEKYIAIEAQKTDKIQYYGFVPKKELKIIEDEIDIFVNPRQESEEYTKYSFPSKNAEYLLTGKPLIAYMLSGIPEEYSEFIYVPKDNTAKELANTIEKVANEDTYSLNMQAKKQMKFMKSKSGSVQGKKIVEFLSSLS